MKFYALSITLLRQFFSFELYALPFAFCYNGNFVIYYAYAKPEQQS